MSAAGAEGGATTGAGGVEIIARVEARVSSGNGRKRISIAIITLIVTLRLSTVRGGIFQNQ